MYEITFIATDENGTKTVTDLLKKENATISFEYPMGRKQFAYPIKKETAGYYACIYFDIDQTNIEKLTKNLYAQKEILRFLLVKSEQNIKELKDYLQNNKKQTEKINKKEANKDNQENKIIEKTEELNKKTIEINEEEVDKKDKDSVKDEKVKPAAKKIKASKTKVTKEVKENKLVEKKEEQDKDRIKKLEEKLDELLKE